MRILPKLAFALATATALGAAAPAAQARDGFSVTFGFGHTDGHRVDWRGPDRNAALHPRALARILAAQSYYDIERLKLRGDVYTARATDFRGERVRLTVDAYTGRVLSADLVRARVLPFESIEAALRGSGYRRVRQTAFDGRFYTARAIDEDRERVALTIDARTGRVTRIEVVDGGGWRGERWADDDRDDRDRHGPRWQARHGDD